MKNLLTKINGEPVALAGVAIALANVLTAFTEFSTEQDLAVNGVAIALAAYLARRKVTPIAKN